MSGQTTTIRTYDGEDADVIHLGDTDDGRRFKVSGPDDREWIVHLEIPGGEFSIEVSRRDGEPADLDVPEWLEDNLARMAQPA